jgi:hypothetical protein
MVEASQLGAALAGAEVRLRSRSSDVIVGTALADRLILTNLVLAAADSVEVDVDEGLRDYSLDLANLAVFSDEDDDGVGRILLTTEQTDRDSDLEADEYSRASIRTLDRQIYFGDVAVGANVRLKGNEVIFRDTVEAFTSQDVDASLEVKVNNRARFADDVGVVAPLDRLEVILGQPPANALTEAGFAERSDLGDTILVLRKEPDPSGGAGRANPERMTVRTQGNLHLRRKETDVPRTAVIRAEGDELVDQFLFQSDGGNVAFGEQMRMAVDGSLRVESRDPGDPATGDAPGKVKVADLAVAGRLALDAPEVFIRRRDGGRMLQASGAEVLDPGTLIVANDLSIETNNLVLSGEGRDPLFGLPNPLDAPDSLRGADGTLVYPVAAIKRNFEPIDGSDIRLQETDPDRPNFGRLTDTFTMIRPDGPSAADLAPDLNSDLDRLAPDLHQPLPLVVAALDERSLDTIGIALRGTTAAERESRREGAAVYDDVRPVRDPVRVVSTRLMADMTGEAARSYDRLFGRNGENAPRIREILQGALDHYRRETRARRVVGFEFRRYVKNRPSSEFEAHQALLELDRLFRSHRNSGLSREEYREIQASWLASIQPDGITTEELAEAIHPSRYVRGSDILDIFGD